ncbi:MAG TPA: DEAD/DEAH box helicase, partial [Nannocystaceae bacterium]|nr:DEAD/DEAH box helicase [Nannocystaceae bacterium]
MADFPESGNTPDRAPDDTLTQPAAEKSPEDPPPAIVDAPASLALPASGETAPAHEAPVLHEEGALVGPLTTVVPESFDDFNLDPRLHGAILRMGWLRPTPVQALSFEPLIAGEDVIVQSHTGSGKTGAFCIPWLAKRFDPRPASETGVQILVLLPTRELAKQVCGELGRLGQGVDLALLPVYGGTAMQPQLTALKNGVHAVVGTPGRILDHIRRRSLDLSQVRTVVLDECDEMLSMGFLEDIRAILEACRGEHQTCLFSATVQPDVQRIARRYMKTPRMVELSGDQVAAAEIDHAYYMISGMMRTRDLLDVLVVEDPARAIVFCNTREETKLVANVLTREGYEAEALSSDLTQAAREHVMRLMREGKIRFLVATDVAARGIDISAVTHVINYSFPEQAEVYVHRTGRTGRAGRAGTALSLIGPRDIGNFYTLKLQYPSIKVHERHLPPAEQLAADRTELRLDKISRIFPEQVSPEWILMARSLMGDPRGERVVALLLERAMRAHTQRIEEAMAATAALIEGAGEAPPIEGGVEGEAAAPPIEAGT